MQSNQCRYLFVYGTLMRGDRGRTHPLLRGLAEWLGPARYPGRLYLVADYPGLVPGDPAEDQVRGELYYLRKPRELLPRLDIYEGCSVRHPRPREYRRTLEAVHREDGEPCGAWVYLYNWSVNRCRAIPGGDFRALCPPRLRGLR